MLVWLDPHARISRFLSSGTRCPREIDRMELAFLTVVDILFRHDSPGFLHFTTAWQVEFVTRVLQVEGRAHRFPTHHVGGLSFTVGMLSGVGTRYDKRHTHLTHRCNILITAFAIASTLRYLHNTRVFQSLEAAFLHIFMLSLGQYPNGFGIHHVDTRFVTAGV